jgi:hypothetical protein
MSAHDVAASYFEKLGKMVSRKWLDLDYNEASFSDVAVSALEELPPTDYITINDVLSLGLLSDVMITQKDMGAMFGQPPLVVYNGDDFHIVVLFWIDGEISIHEHSFSGAFHVLHGSSLHTNWSFDVHEQLSVRLRVGDLSLNKAEYLRTGSTRAIVAGNRLIHATYHLDCPSVSIVVRTNSEENHLPQCAYYAPTIAEASFLTRDSAQRRAQLLQMLVNAGRYVEFGELVRQVIEKADSYAIVTYLRVCYPLLNDETDRRELVNMACAKDRRLEPYLLPMLLHRDRQLRIAEIRRRFTGQNPNLRLFLALLINIPDRNEIRRMLAEIYPLQDSRELIASWLVELSAAGAFPIRLPSFWAQVIPHLLDASSDLEAFQHLVNRKELCIEQYRQDDVVNLVHALRSWWLLSPLTQNVSEYAYV